MQRNCCLFLFPILFSPFLFAQSYKVSGKITNNKLEPLALVSIQVKELLAGTITKEDGTYELKLEEGNYDIIISMLGFKTQIISLVVNRDYVQNIILETDEMKNLAEVVIRGKGKDRSEEIIRNVIHNKENILAASGAYSLILPIGAPMLGQYSTALPIPLVAQPTVAGKYTIEASANGYKTQSVSKDISTADATQSFTLVP